MLLNIQFLEFVFELNLFKVNISITKDNKTLFSGEQNSLVSVIKHTFTRRAFNVTCGPFGSSKSRDLICIQALDGTLSFFDQDTFLFMCLFDDIIIPGPVCYAANSDLFVICKSTWVLEIYRYVRNTFD